MKKKNNKVKKVIDKVLEKIQQTPLHECISFKTTDKDLVNKLLAKGFTLKTVISPFAERKEKLYVFNEDEKKIKEAIDG